ncbi:MAG: BON domain-containing protein [Gammaproteobacteria bacterium]|nr:BON domain-containing protein [Gammaproteobacteria bacterium]MBV9696413.1 BON domain-containing protein [Gammaproteobacteria bacterium]
MDKRILAGILAGYFVGPAWGTENPDPSEGAQAASGSPITSAIRDRLAAEHDQSLAELRVDSDLHGTVWLSGRAESQIAADHAVEIARATQGVADVKSNIVVAPETRQ